MALETKHCWKSPVWKELESHAETIKSTHLRNLMEDSERCNNLRTEIDGVCLDYSRQQVTIDTMTTLYALSEEMNVHGKLKAMASGEKLNTTEGRSVLHTALRTPKNKSLIVDGVDVVAEVHAVLDKIETFTDKVRSGEWVGATGKPLTDVVSIGIGGSYLGPEFVFEALKNEPTAYLAAKGRNLRFLANVDPVDVSRALEGYNPETTLVCVVSKTFTTAETMLNARTIRNWLTTSMSSSNASDVVAKHMIALSSNIPGATAFGINASNVFGFWDWVGGRYSVCSAVGVMPLALQYGMPIVREFLAGAHNIDEDVISNPKSIPMIMGLLGVWNSTFLGYESRALLPYSQALLRFAAHIQQVDMESNGKRVHLDGTPLPFAAGEVNFGEPGTNGQHSFYQLIHQGRTVPCDFLGFCKSQCPRELEGEVVSNHDELMSNFFAQPDALAYGKTIEQLEKEGVAKELRTHKEFPGNKPSMSILMNELNAFTCGQILAIYEHRTAVQGFVWGNNSFDQWGVELGKVLAKTVRNQLNKSRKESAKVTGFNASTTAMIEKYLK